MGQTKQLGIWMNHTTAHLMELVNDQIEKTTIESEYTLQAEETGTINFFTQKLAKNTEYYKTLRHVIGNYDDVLIFGPTSAKNELLNVLNNDHNLKIVKLEVRSADEMTEMQEVAFVKDYFMTNGYAYKMAV